jgi:hypothetical protein
MRSEFGSFDEYWSAFVLEHWRETSRRRRVVRVGKGLARLALGVVSPRLSALITVPPLNLRWAAAATLLSWGKSLAGTLDDEIARVGTIDTAAWPPVEAAAELGPAPAPLKREPRSRGEGWAVWL